MPRPEIFFERGWWLTCHVRILVVTDASSGGFGEEEGFHLGQVLKVLDDDPWSHVRFVFTKAHRQTGDGADVISNFRFDEHTLSNYSQIWLFGISRFEDPLSQSELRALTQFMDNGGGVFATGDHENLGLPMCGEVPRVRSMRRWYYPSPGPNGEPVAPAQVGTDRHDTVVNLSVGGNQSDKEPQPIRLEYETRTSGSGFIYKVHKFPHPVLCGAAGRIEYLADHMHEGLCEVPSDLGKSWTFDGYTSVEYPIVGGERVEPQVIAWATTRNTTGREFGVLAAYDGHQANVGRVLVDATWHHWFNINLTGFLSATNPAHPSYDPTIVPKWEAIKAYFRNVGLWLANPSLQNCLRNGGYLIISRYYDILITFQPLDRVTDVLTYYWQLGVFARDAMGKLASHCQTTHWAIKPIEWLEYQLYPWPPLRKRPLPEPPPWLDLTDLEHIALGGAVHELVSHLGNEQNAQEVLDRRGDEVEALIRRGAIAGVAELAKRYEIAGEEAARLAELVKRQQ